MSNIVVLGAIEKKPTPVKRQVRFQITARQSEIAPVFLVIPHLTSNMIIGSDWMLRTGMIIDFAHKDIAINGVNIPPELTSFGRPASEKLSVSEDNDITYIQIIKTVHKTIRNFLKISLKQNHLVG